MCDIMLKASVSNQYLANSTWAPARCMRQISICKNIYPTARNWHHSPYQLYDTIIIDLKNVPMLPIGTRVVGRFAPNEQSLQVPGRDIETTVVGGSPFGFGGLSYMI